MPERIIKVAWTPIVDRRIPFARTRGQTLFYTIGGKVKPGETLVGALMREVSEESYARLIPGTIQLIHTFVGPCHGYPKGTVLEMHCYNAQHEGNMLEPSGEVDTIELFNVDDKHRTTEMGREMLDWFHLRYFRQQLFA